MENKSTSRRHFLAQTATVALAVGGGLTARSAAAEQLNPEDAQAKALGYVHASTTDGQTCMNCQFYTGAADAEWGPCGIFPGKDVAAKGWCKTWVQKAG